MDIELAASLAKVTLGTKNISGLLIRKCRMAFDREFDDEIAAALGGGAKKALAGLRAHDLQKVVMGIDTVNVSARLRCGDDTVSVGQCRGEKATGKAGDDDEPPMIRLAFETAYNDDVWSFLGRNCGAYVSLEFKDSQLTLGGSVSSITGEGSGLRPI